MFKKQADSLLNRGKYLTAVKLYKKVIEKSPNDSLEFNIKAFYDIGFAYQNSRVLDSALFYYSLGDKLLKGKETNELLYEKYFNISSYHFARLSTDSAMHYALKSLHFAKKTKVPLKIAISSNAIGRIFLEQKNLEKARYYLETGENISKKTNDSLLKADSQMYLGRLAFAKKEYQTSKKYINKALDYYTTLNDTKGILISKSYLAKILLSQGKLAESFAMSGSLVELMNQFEYTGDLSVMVANTNKLKNLEKKGKDVTQENIKEAKKIVEKNIALTEALETKIQQNKIIIKNIEDADVNKTRLEVIYPKRELSKKLDFTLNLQDSLYQNSLNSNYLELETKYQTQQKEKEIIALKQKETESLLEIEKQKKQNAYYIGIIILLGLFAFLIFIYAKNRKRKLIEKNQLQIIQAKDEQSNQIAIQLHDGKATRLKDLAAELDELKVLPIAKELKEMSKNIRNLSYELKRTPFSESELNKQLVTLASKNDNENLRINLKGHDKINWPIWEEAVKRNVYVIVQQALINITEHAEASTVLIEFRQDGKKLNLQIKDNGKGFETQPENFGVGITSMRIRVRELNGKIKIESTKTIGTSIFIQLTLV